MRGMGRARGVARIVLAAAVGLTAVVVGVAPGGVAPAAAECGMQFPDTRIGSHRGFAFDGVIAAIDRLPEQSVARITMDVTEMLAGDPVEQVAFDLGRGSCWFLQVDRYKVGDRLIVTASAPPVDAEERYLPDALTWRYEWGDTWSLHGIPPQEARRFSRPIRDSGHTCGDPRARGAGCAAVRRRSGRVVGGVDAARVRDPPGRGGRVRWRLRGAGHPGGEAGAAEGRSRPARPVSLRHRPALDAGRRSVPRRARARTRTCSGWSCSRTRSMRWVGTWIR